MSDAKCILVGLITAVGFYGYLYLFLSLSNVH